MDSSFFWGVVGWGGGLEEIAWRKRDQPATNGRHKKETLSVFLSSRTNRSLLFPPPPPSPAPPPVSSGSSALPTGWNGLDRLLLRVFSFLKFLPQDETPPLSRLGAGVAPLAPSLPPQPRKKKPRLEICKKKTKDENPKKRTTPFSPGRAQDLGKPNPREMARKQRKQQKQQRDTSRLFPSVVGVASTTVGVFSALNLFFCMAWFFFVDSVTTDRTGFRSSRTGPEPDNDAAPNPHQTPVNEQHALTHSPPKNSTQKKSEWTHHLSTEDSETKGTRLRIKRLVRLQWASKKKYPFSLLFVRGILAIIRYCIVWLLGATRN